MPILRDPPRPSLFPSRYLILESFPKNSRRLLSSRSVKVLMQSFLQYVLIRSPLGSSQRAQANVCAAVNLQS